MSLLIANKKDMWIPFSVIVVGINTLEKKDKINKLKMYEVMLNFTFIYVKKMSTTQIIKLIPDFTLSYMKKINLKFAPKF